MSRPETEHGKIPSKLLSCCWCTDQKGTRPNGAQRMVAAAPGERSSGWEKQIIPQILTSGLHQGSPTLTAIGFICVVVSSERLIIGKKN